MPLNFVIFPAEALHGSSPISSGNYKLALKIDL